MCLFVLQIFVDFNYHIILAFIVRHIQKYLGKTWAMFVTMVEQSFKRGSLFLDIFLDLLYPHIVYMPIIVYPHIHYMRIKEIA